MELLLPLPHPLLHVASQKSWGINDPWVYSQLEPCGNQCINTSAPWSLVGWLCVTNIGSRVPSGDSAPCTVEAGLPANTPMIDFSFSCCHVLCFLESLPKAHFNKHHLHANACLESASRGTQTKTTSSRAKSLAGGHQTFSCP